MNKTKLTPFIFLGVSLLFLNGCTPRALIVDTDRNNRYVDLGYSYFEHGFRKRLVDWSSGSKLATEQCVKWGYDAPINASDPTLLCKRSDGYGKCAEHVDIKRYQCEFTADQKRQQELAEQIKKQEEQIKKQKEQKEIEIAKKRAVEDEARSEALIKEWNRAEQQYTQYIQNNCFNYQISKQSCATAGSYDKCMEIKLNLLNGSARSISLFGFTATTENILNSFEQKCNK